MTNPRAAALAPALLLLLVPTLACGTARAQIPGAVSAGTAQPAADPSVLSAAGAAGSQPSGAASSQLSGAAGAMRPPGAANPAAGAGAFTYSVRAPRWGARGDGAADDTAAIQAAIAAVCAARGGTVYLPEGTYLVRRTLDVPCPGVTLRGAGPAATTLLTTEPASDMVAFTSGKAANSAGGVRDMSFASAVTRTAGAAIRIDRAYDGLLDNLRLATTGGDGIQFTAGGVWFVSHLAIEIAGPFAGIVLDGGNDRFIEHAWIQGNNAAGSSGIRILASGGDFLTDVDIVGFDYGVSVAPVKGQSVTALSFVNVLCDSGNTRGFSFTPRGGFLAQTTCTSCWASSNGAGSHPTGDGRGIYIDGGTDYYFSFPRVYNNGGHGIDIQHAQNITIVGGYSENNSSAAADTWSGINLVDDAGVILQAHRASGSQKHGLTIDAASTRLILTGNDLDIQSAAPLTPPGTAAHAAAAGQPAAVPTVACTGLGAAGTAAVAGTDAAFEITLSPAAGTATAALPPAAGSCTVTFAAPYAGTPVCVVSLASGSADWSAAGTIAVTAPSATAPVLSWHDGAALTAGATYKIDGICLGQPALNARRELPRKGTS